MLEEQPICRGQGKRKMGVMKQGDTNHQCQDSSLAEKERSGAANGGDAPGEANPLLHSEKVRGKSRQ